MYLIANLVKNVTRVYMHIYYKLENYEPLFYIFIIVWVKFECQTLIIILLF